MRVEKLSLSFWNKNVLSEIDFNINKWEFVFLIWYSWSWKTSFIRSLIWDLKPIKGDIILDNSNSLYQHYSEKLINDYRKTIWVVFQDYKLLESKTVYENVAFAMEVCNFKDKDILKKVPEILEQVWLLIKKDKYITELSWWEKQRVSIARALVNNPDLIIWDEPTWNLDPQTAENIMNIFQDLNNSWKTIIIATHDKNIVDKFKKRVITFKDKKVYSDKNNWIYNL